MSYEPVLLPKFSPDGTIILAKEQVHNSYTFCAMSILIFSPFANFGKQSLIHSGMDGLPTQQQHGAFCQSNVHRNLISSQVIQKGIKCKKTKE